MLLRYFQTQHSFSFWGFQWPFTVCGTMQTKKFWPLDKANDSKKIPALCLSCLFTKQGKKTCQKIATYAPSFGYCCDFQCHHSSAIGSNTLKQLARFRTHCRALIFGLRHMPQTLGSLTPSPHSLQLFLLLGKSFWTQPLWVPMRHWHRWYINICYIVIQARHVAGIPHAMRLGLGVSRSLELLRKCDTVQFMLLVQYSDAPTPPTRVSVVSSILMQNPSVGKKNKIHRNPKPEIQNPNAKLQHFLSRFWVSFFRDATPWSWGLPSWKRTARWFNHSCRLHCNLSYRSIGDHITSEGIYSMTYSGDFGRVNWKSAPTWTFSECLTSLGNLARSNLLEICADLAHINAHPCVFYLLHPRVFRTRQWCFLGRPLTSAINPAIRLCIFVEACWTAKIAVFWVQ